jgi:hypothetical protein
MWEARDDLERTRRRQLLPVIVLAALAVTLCLPWLEVGSDGDNTLLGWLTLEVVVLVPLVFGARRVNRVSALIARAEAYSYEDQALETATLRTTDESIWRVGQLVASLDDGPARTEARAALAAAERAARVLRPLVQRRTQLEHLIDTSRSRPAAAKLRTTLEACVADIGRLESTIASVAASVAMLVDAASEAAYQRELDPLRRLTEDLKALVDAFDDIAEIEESAGLGPGPI